MPKHPEHVEVVGNFLALKWTDGGESYLELEFLRRSCPCANCAGEPDVTGAVRRPAAPPVYGNASFEVMGTERVGNYALSITWADGHRTGIYSWELLQRLESLAADPGAVEGSGDNLDASGDI